MNKMEKLLFLIWLTATFDLYSGQDTTSYMANDPPPQHVFDQRQSGRYNIHLNIKDIAIIALGKGSGSKETDNSVPASDEYYYDENDLTIKPMPDLYNLLSTNNPLVDITAATAPTAPPAILSMAPNDEATSPFAIAEDETQALNATQKPISLESFLAENALKLKYNNTEELFSVTSAPFVISSVPSTSTSTKKTTTTPAPWIPSTSTKKQNIVIIEEQTPVGVKPPNFPIIHHQIEPVPVQVIMEPLLQHKYTRNNHNLHALHPSTGRDHSVELLGENLRRDFASTNSNRRNRIRLRKRCHRGQFLDIKGSCRKKRRSSSGSSLLEKLINVINAFNIEK